MCLVVHGNMSPTTVCVTLRFSTIQPLVLTSVDSAVDHKQSGFFPENHMTALCLKNVSHMVLMRFPFSGQQEVEANR